MGRLHPLSFTYADVARCDIWPWRRSALSKWPSSFFVLFFVCHKLLLEGNRREIVALANEWTLLVPSEIGSSHGDINGNVTLELFPLE